ncbi:MAG: DNA polymerase III subunit delta' [Acidimicrobiales bacterium]
MLRKASGSDLSVGSPPVLDRIVGQPRARAVLGSFVASPVHAFFFVGPPGSGKRDAARAFAAALVCPHGGCGDCPSCRAVVMGGHPDVVFVERHGASILVEEAREVVQLAQRTPRTASRQVLVLTDFHLVDRAAPALLKTIEEPPATTVIIVLADARAPALVTIASRCVEVEFSPLDAEAIAAALRADGAAEEVAIAAASAANGRLDRARLLVEDPGFASREARWRAVPERLDGTGVTVATLAAELLAATDELLVVLSARQAAELDAVDAAAELAGERRAPGRRAIEERHRREQRQVRTDELRAGLATLASAYRFRLGVENLPARRAASLVAACQEIDAAAARLSRNPNETLLVEALLLRLDGLN